MASRRFTRPFQLWLPPRVHSVTFQRPLRQQVEVLTCARSSAVPEVGDRVESLSVNSGTYTIGAGARQPADRRQLAGISLPPGCPDRFHTRILRLVSDAKALQKAANVAANTPCRGSGPITIAPVPSSSARSRIRSTTEPCVPTVRSSSPLTGIQDSRSSATQASISSASAFSRSSSIESSPRGRPPRSRHARRRLPTGVGHGSAAPRDDPATPGTIRKRMPGAAKAPG